MTFRRLLFWGDLEAHRRRAGRRGFFALSPWLHVAVVGALVFAEIARRLGAFGGSANVASASGMLLAVMAMGGATAALGAPFRMYWRHDAALLARLPIPGRALYGMAWTRQLRASAALVAPSAVAALAFVAWADATLFVRHGLLAVATFGVAGALAPAAALLAGQIAASDKAHQMISNVAGEVAAPRTGWLGVLPGVVAAAVILFVIGGATWARGEHEATAVGAPAVFFAVAMVPSALAASWAVIAAPHVMSRAAAEVAALDRQILAHVERVPASATERAWSKIWLRDAGARAVYDKDARLLRRRYPLATLAVFVTVITLWILAWQAPDQLVVEAAVLAGLCFSALILHRRLLDSPLEAPRLLAALPIAPAAALAAKRALILLRVVMVALAGGIPAILRAENPALTAVVLIAIIGLTAAAIAAGRAPILRQ